MNSFLLFAMLLFNCQQSEKKEQATYSKKEQGFNNFQPDTTVNKKLYLRDDVSIESFFSNYKKLSFVDKLRESPVIIFTNRSSEEYLLAYQYEGDTKNSFSCFEIGYLNNENRINEYQSFKTEYADFKTETGLKLGISLAELIKIKGNNYKEETKNNKFLIKYTIDDMNSSFIKKYAMPPYFMSFYLENDKVYKIIFGFEYP